MIDESRSSATGNPSECPDEIRRARSLFPSLTGGSIRFDGAAGSETPEPVIRAMAAYLQGANANGHAAYPESSRSNLTAQLARRAAASFLGAERDQICFGLNATSLNYMLSRTASQVLVAGDEIVTTRLDHQANIAPWEAVARDRNLAVKVVDIDDDTTIDLDDLCAKISERTRIVAFPWASNVVGTIADVAAISRLAHEAGALSWVDATHFAPHGPIDVAAAGADVLVCSAYKFFGPHLGIGFVHQDLLDRWIPYGFAEGRGRGEGLENGTLPYAALASLPAAIDYIAATGWPTITNWERLLTERFISGLPRRFQLHGLSRSSGRTPTFAITAEGIPAAQLATHLSEQNLAVRAGDMHSGITLHRIGLEQVVRISFLHYNTATEIDRLLTELDRLSAAIQMAN